MKTWIVLGIMAVLGLVSSGNAQVCSVGHTRSQRPLVLEQQSYANQILTRMSELATLSASGVYSQTQRMALNNEFHAWKSEMDRFGAEPRLHATSRTRDFLDDVVDADFLGLASATILGSTIEESQRLSREALDAVNIALSQLSVCLAGSWDRLEIVGEPNGGDCAGGYDRRDRVTVLVHMLRAVAKIRALADIARDSAFGVYGVTQRTVRQFELEYTREEVEILGESFVPRVSRRTRHFLRTVIDPIFLNTLEARVDGENVYKSQQHALAALASFKDARRTGLFCLVSGS